MTILIIAEHNASALTPGTLACVTAARSLAMAVDMLLLGNDVHGVAEQAKTLEGVAKIIVVQSEDFRHALAETYAEAVLTLAGNYDYLVAPATTFGKNLMPRIAARLDIQQVSDVVQIVGPKTFVRPIYAGNALQTVETSQEKNVLTIRPTSFALAVPGGGTAVVEEQHIAVPKPRSAFAGISASKGDRPDLASAKIVVSGGRAIGSKENFALIEGLADQLGAAIGASRAAVDAGYVPNDYQVGQTGKIVAPDLYMAIGISGAIQHLAGIGGAKVIVAINKDPEAPIFQVADYGLVGDLFQIIPELQQALKDAG